MHKKPVRLETLEAQSDGRRYSPSAARNRDAILEALRQLVPEQGVVLEIASGTGEHAVHCVRALPGLRWHASDRDAEALRSIRAWRKHAALPGIQAVHELDVCGDWPAELLHTGVDAVLAINFFHITPWHACEALLAGAARVLRPHGQLLVYGAFMRSTHETAASNLDFDRKLRASDPAYGVRQVEAVEASATTHGLVLASIREMPKQNLLLRFQLDAQDAPYLPTASQNSTT